MSRSVLLASSLLTLIALSGPVRGQPTPAKGYEANCESASGNARSDETICVGFEFSDGTNEISAGLAATNKFDFDGSLWRLTDGVRLAFETAEIIADAALLRFEADVLVIGELNGSPVIMSDYIEERETPVSGTAQSVSYDSRSGTVHLIGPGTLVVGDNEYMGCDWIYNFNEKTYDAGASDDCSGVQIRLTPPEQNDEAAGQPDPP